jgi:hypothetical protein
VVGVTAYHDELGLDGSGSAVAGAGPGSWSWGPGVRPEATAVHGRRSCRLGSIVLAAMDTVVIRPL